MTEQIHHNTTMDAILKIGSGAIEFDFLEYSVFSMMLGLSALIGVYYGFIKGGQDTVDGYLLGGKRMGLFPISMSLTSSYVSGITFLGMPSEIYTFGTQYMAQILCFFIVGGITLQIFLPVFYKLQVISVYEYLELRFSKGARKMASLFYTVALFFHTPVVIYGPALALNQVSGMNIHVTAFVLCIICIFYTTVGGLKAVVWTDTLQAAIMAVSSLVVAGIGTAHVGGFSSIIHAAEAGDRLHFFNMDPDPRERLTFWTAVVGFTVAGTASSSINPSVVQRFVSLNTINKARWSVLNFTIGTCVLFFLSCYMGLVIYAQYQFCDPKALGLIKNNDQILPYFILDVTGKYRGLPGLFLAGVVSAALSTMSTGLNTVAGTFYEDFYEPVFGKTTDAKASRVMKVLSVSFGGLCLIMIFVVERLGSLLELSYSFAGLTAGSILGMFILGMFFPQANSKGAICGGLSGILIQGCIFVGSRAAIARGELEYPVKPVAVDGCPFNTTGLDVNLPGGGRTGEIFPLLELSVFYYVTVGTLTTVLTGLAVSYLTGANKAGLVDRSLLTPVIHPLLARYDPLPLSGTELVHIKA